MTALICVCVGVTGSERIGVVSNKPQGDLGQVGLDGEVLNFQNAVESDRL